MQNDCIFCKIVEGQIPSEKIYEDDQIIAFNDINPAAPVHFLVIPKMHIATLDDVSGEHEHLLGRMLCVASRLAREKGVADDGYRQVINCKRAGGQVVFHIHVHILGGRPMGRMG